jgi:uncharacterized protein
MTGKLGLCAVAVVIGLAPPALAADRFPQPSGYLVDASDAIPDQDQQALEAELTAYATRSGHQLAVAVVPTAGGNIDNYANDLFGRWGVGSKERDDGVLIVVATSDRQLRIEVGRGLEGDLTDLQAAEIIRDDMVPPLRAGSVTDAVRAGERSVRRVLGDPTPDAPGDPAAAGFNGFGGGAPTDRQHSSFPLFPVLLLGFLAVAFLSRRGRRRGRGGGMFFPLFLGSGFGGGGFGGGGGFSGGGGGFGGFGGGSSGGGGASGSW